MLASQDNQSDFFATPAGPQAEGMAYRPLSTRMRPRTLAEVVGQTHLVGPDCLLPRLIKANQLGSVLFYGPPGSGKTTLAEVIAAQTASRFIRLNAVMSNVAELRDVLRLARQYPQERPILFIDEIHRFNKAQQDLLLPDVEAGHVRLIGATTHNPSFYLTAPLLSRSQLFRLEPLSLEAITQVLEAALVDTQRGLGAFRCEAAPGVLETIAGFSEGDLRRALNALEVVVQSLPLGAPLSPQALEAFALERHIRYDRNEDEHYDTASAFIKSIRGGDPDAALYWLAKMLAGGEDPRFIARRLVILASEDVGMADPRGLSLAMATFQACEAIGLPECGINLAHAVVFLATAPKSNTAYMAFQRAQAAIAKGPVQSVPLWLRSSKTAIAKELGYGVGYEYSHDFPEAVSGQDYQISPDIFYTPKPVGAEALVAERLMRWKALKAAIKGSSHNP